MVALNLDLHQADGPAVNGLETLRSQLDIRGLANWPATFTLMTPHLYFRAPASCTIGSVSGWRSPLGPGIDVRGPGRRCSGYLAGPGSVLGGLPYLIACDLPVAPLPNWITTALLTCQKGRPRDYVRDHRRARQAHTARTAGPARRTPARPARLGRPDAPDARSYRSA
ncbi:bifunctional DNA primase/polymerase [Streptomyces californicus]|uniref:bifunctional DNA primase/polymerase n=1 Tax=Streptomyces californicus TaxID=67351 RepID=UPI003797C185